MIKFRLYFDKDEETNWLNAMSAEGWAMAGFFAGFYKFNECERGKYIYQVDFGDRWFAVSDEYRDILQDAGVEIVQTWGYWIILRKLAAEGKFELYTDVASNIEHYSKIRRMFKVGMIAELICLFIVLFLGLQGNQIEAALCFPIGVIIIAFANALARTNNIINKLKESQTGIAVKKQRNISVLFLIGLWFNSCWLLMEEVIPHYVRRPVQIMALIFMLAGLGVTWWSGKK